MINKLAVFSLLISVLLLSSACSSHDESEIRTTIDSCFKAAQRGDIEFALDFLSETSSVKIMITKAESEDLRDRLIAEYSALAMDHLDAVTYQIKWVNVSGVTAEVELEFSKGRSIFTDRFTMEKQTDTWLLMHLPVFLPVENH